jgi:hypothetical protein
MASLLGSILNSLLHGGEVHDYAHAAQVFRTNNFSRAPKSKYLFYVNFVLASDVPNYIDASEIGYLVKTVDLPKFTMDVKDLNQYNRHVYIQDRIKYEPVNIKFHDDNSNGLRELWQNYYNYYYADGNYGFNDYQYDDRYQDRLHSSWGLDNGSLTPFFSAIEIYSMFGGESNKITLMNPVITSFQHDTHDYSEGQGIMEATMQVRYNGVTYEQGYTGGIPGFNDSAFYDNNLSGLSGQYGRGYYVNPITGGLEPQGQDFYNQSQLRQQARGSFGFADQTNQYYPSTNTGFSQQEIESIINNNASNQNGADTVFPLANTISPSFSQNSPDRQPIFNPDSATGFINPDQPSLSPSTVNPFSDGSYQSGLWNQGYSIDQINGATNFVNTVPQTTLDQYGFQNSITAQTVIAQQYIDNPTNVIGIGTINYGQPNSIPSMIDFNNPAAPVNPIYTGSSWQQTLLSSGYSTSDIALASTQIAQLNVAPGTDLVPVAKNYIAYSKNNVA